MVFKCPAIFSIAIAFSQSTVPAMAKSENAILPTHLNALRVCATLTGSPKGISNALRLRCYDRVVHELITPPKVSQNKKDTAVTGKQNRLDVNSQIHATDFIKVLNWRADATKDDYKIDVSYTLKNVSKKKIAFVDGGLVFKDVSGATISRLRIPRDLNLKPQTSKVTGGRYYNFDGPDGTQRLLRIQKSLVRVSISLKSVVFADGTVIKMK